MLGHYFTYFGGSGNSNIASNRNNTVITIVLAVFGHRAWGKLIRAGDWLKQPQGFRLRVGGLMLQYFALDMN